MSLEKKLGLSFVGMLFLTFCGVLTMRLMNADSGPAIDINVAGVASATPAPPTSPMTPNAPQHFNSSPASQSRPTFVAEQRQQPQAANSFASSGGSPFATSPAATSVSTTAYGSTGAGMTSQAPSSAAASTSSPARMPSNSSSGISTDNRYAAGPSSPSVAGYASPSPISASSQPLASSVPPLANSMPSTTTSAVATAGATNPLRSTPPTTTNNLSAVTSASPGTLTSQPPAAARPTDDGRFATPNIGNIGSTSMAASNTPPTAASVREPRPFDAGTLPPQPLTSTTPSGAAGTQTTQPHNTTTTTVPSQPSGIATLAPPAAAGYPQPATMPQSTTSSVSPASATLPVASGRDQPYVVAPGETLFTIAQKVYGDGSLYRALFAYNSDRYPTAEGIRSGNVLDVPPADFLKQRFPELIGGADPTTNNVRAASAGGSYTVREGDTLFDIARKQLGQASRWTELYEANRTTLGENLENLRPGVTLRLP